MSTIMRGLGVLALGALAAGAIAYALLTLSGRTLRIEPRDGTPTAVEVRFATPEARLVAPGDEGARPRSVILLIADGMGFAHVAAARAATAGVGGQLLIERFPVGGWLTTHAHDSIYTDSAASAAAMATGSKTSPGLLAISPDGTPLPTIAQAARDAGLGVGLITDSYLWDATPSAFTVHAARRAYDQVVPQLASSGFPVLVGTVHQEIDAADLATFEAYFTDAGREVADRVDVWQDSLDQALPAVGLLAAEDVVRPDRQPSLAALTAAAIERLAQFEAGFFLMVETEETDTASHINDFDRMIAGLAAFDAAAAVAVEHARRDGETLVLVTADHETGGLSLLEGTPGEPLRIRWATHGHTAAPVPIFAYGPGAEAFAGRHDNTAVATEVAALLGLRLEAKSGDP